MSATSAVCGLHAAPVTLGEYRELWSRPGTGLQGPCLFTLPAWLEAWSATRGHDADPYVWAVYCGERVVGLAPLLRDGEEARFLGDSEVCDYQDLVLAQGEEGPAVACLCDALRDDGVRVLRLGSLRPESQVLRQLVPRARAQSAAVDCRDDGVAVEVSLPGDWEEYLGRLTKKRRHELRRKLRRLEEAGRVDFRRYREPEEIRAREETFFQLFRANRPDKASFMGEDMEEYFRVLLRATARDGVLRLGVLSLNGEAAAAVLSFVHAGRVHLYNNGYRSEARGLSVGLLSKALDLKKSLEEDAGTYDLLKGEEPYKFRLGGRRVPLSHCTVRWPEPATRRPGKP